MSNVLRVRTEPGGEWTEIPSIQGPQGEDGFSPTVTTTPIDGGTKVTITDAEGPHEFNVMNGSGGASTASDVSFDDTTAGLGTNNPNAPIDTVQKAIEALAEDDIGSQEVQDMIDDTNNPIIMNVLSILAGNKGEVGEPLGQVQITDKTDTARKILDAVMNNGIVINMASYTTATITSNMLQNAMGFDGSPMKDNPFASWRKHYTCDNDGNISETTLNSSTGIVLKEYDAIVRIGKYNFLFIPGKPNYGGCGPIDEAIRYLLKYFITQYNNTTSGLTATTLSGAIDELAARPSGVSEATVNQKIAEAIAAITDFTEVSF